LFRETLRETLPRHTVLVQLHPAAILRSAIFPRMFARRLLPARY
jgi:hypothetical protein